jgi:hypothetical protein
MPNAIKLTDLPPCEPNVSTASVLTGSRRGGGHSAWIAYDAKGPDWPNSDEVVALVRLDDVAQLVTNGPNDEAFHNHPFYRFGLRPYALQELVDSPWIAMTLSMLHKDRVPTNTRGRRHFVFALKESTVDCLAASAVFVGYFPTHVDAIAAACSEVRS